MTFVHEIVKIFTLISRFIYLSDGVNAIKIKILKTYCRLVKWSVSKKIRLSNEHLV